MSCESDENAHYTDLYPKIILSIKTVKNEFKKQEETNMNETINMISKKSAFAAFGVAILFLLRFPTYQLSQENILIILLAIAPHVLLFPVVAALPAPSWAKAAGFGWLVIDITQDIMALHGVAPSIYLPIRYGGHVSAALWIAFASWQSRGWIRLTGLLLALDLGSFSFVVHGSFLLLSPTFILLPLWFLLVGRFILKKANV
jgi:hypothetical protein